MTTLLLATLAAQPDPALLDRVAARTKAMEAFTQDAELTMKVVSDELDAQGKSTKHTELVLRVSQRAGKPHHELVSAIEDGKDVTQDKREEFAKEQEKNGDPKKRRGAQASPFHPDERAKYAFSTLAPSKAAPHLVRLAFQPAGEKTSELMMGDAAVDPETGDVVRMTMRPAKNPLFVQHLYLELEFDALTPSGRALSKLTATGTGGIAFIKKRFAVVTTFGEYRALEKSGAPRLPAE